MAGGLGESFGSMMTHEAGFPTISRPRGCLRVASISCVIPRYRTGVDSVDWRCRSQFAAGAGGRAGDRARVWSGEMERRGWRVFVRPTRPVWVDLRGKPVVMESSPGHNPFGVGNRDTGYPG